MARPGGGCGGPEAAPWELSLEQVLSAYEQPINEEQAWAVCYQCCGGLRRRRRGAHPASLGRIRATADVLLRKDGTVSAQLEPGPDESTEMVSPPANTEAQMVQSLGFAIYRALDWGLDESEERELSPQLEQLIDLMVNSDCEDSSCGAADEGYGGQEEEEEAAAASEGGPRAVRTFEQVMRLCAARLTDPREAQSHYQAVCRALFVETVELKAFLTKIREAKEMLQKLREDEPKTEKPPADLDNLRNTDWARLWVQLMRELRHGVKLKKVQEKQFNPLPTEYQLTPFEMLMQDIRARNYKLRKVMVDGDIPPRVKKDAHELILDFIRSRPPLKQVSERRLRPMPQKQRTLHEKILEEIKQERKLRPVESPSWNTKGFGSLPCLLNACSSDAKSTSCINLSVSDSGSSHGSSQRPRPRVLLKAPTLAEMEEMNISEEEDSPNGEMKRATSTLLPLKRDRSFSERDLAQLQSEMAAGLQPDSGLVGAQKLEPRPRSGSFPINYQGLPSTASAAHSSLGAVEERPGVSSGSDCRSKHLWLEFSHPVESLALTVEEVINVRRVLVKAEMEKFLQDKELYNGLKKGKICCCCRTKFPLFSWPSNCLFCKRAVCTSCSIKMKMPSKKFAHIPVYTLGFENLSGSAAAKTMLTRRRDVFQSLQGTPWRSVEDEFPHIYTHGCIRKDVCNDCTSFVADVISSSRKSVDILNTSPRRSRQTQSLYIPPTWTSKHN
ncbi:protein spire homolog 2 isoform X2 [Tachyglossus aculeatus]|uniref:protein spire homolog 2 isoform X2 n=1 Tax=Tachyglossus aculeatus TaxID=9261 RepID=UPI0018F6F192|nr:protein spire homolog 2 isoform X2 [Tachyglossus aculeatus]